MTRHSEKANKKRHLQVTTPANGETYNPPSLEPELLQAIKEGVRTPDQLCQKLGLSKNAFRKTAQSLAKLGLVSLEYKHYRKIIRLNPAGEG